jgi:hypothetical protein
MPKSSSSGHIGTPWSQAHEPAANTKATTTKAAGLASERHVCTGFSVTLSCGAVAPTAVEVAVQLLDGATVKWAGKLALPAVAGTVVGLARSGLWIVGTAGTAMTLEFSAAGGASTTQVVSLEGTTIGT